jgi:flagellar hook-associated protein 1 FlgK
MSINSAIANAFSGLSLNGRQSEIISRNVANANVEGYAAREITPSHRVNGQEGAGVIGRGPSRATDVFATAGRRDAAAGDARDRALSDAQGAIADLMAPGEGRISLAQRYAELDNRLRALADTPESPTIQTAAVQAADALATDLNRLSVAAQTMRADADAAIARQVGDVNRALEGIEDLNRKIVAGLGVDQDVTALQDQRDRLIDQINEIVPVRVSEREGGRVAVFTQTGGVLIDGRAQVLSFTPTGVVTPDTTLAAGTLGDVTFLNNPAAPTAPTNGRLLLGGSLEAAFRIRDEVGPQFSAQLDALARDLITRFQTAAGAAQGTPPAVGLFVDALTANAVGTGPETGLAGRIEIRQSVDVDRGGATRAIVDAALLAGPTPPGASALPPGDATNAVAMVDAFNERLLGVAPLIGPATGFEASRSAAQRVEDVTALREQGARTAQEVAAFSAGAFESLRDAELTATAVDTDAELRNLLEIEKAYAANARVLQTVDAMLARILEI